MRWPAWVEGKPDDAGCHVDKIDSPSPSRSEHVSLSAPPLDMVCRHLTRVDCWRKLLCVFAFFVFFCAVFFGFEFESPEPPRLRVSLPLLYSGCSSCLQSLASSSSAQETCFAPHSLCGLPFWLSCVSRVSPPRRLLCPKRPLVFLGGCHSRTRLRLFFGVVLELPQVPRTWRSLR